MQAPQLQTETGMTFDNKYTVISKLGQGASAEVYLCSEIANPSNKVALKLIK